MPAKREKFAGALLFFDVAGSKETTRRERVKRSV
jgi:hypothetical protein